jgi:methylenetetrahydrofolate reductase (NADPH)
VHINDILNGKGTSFSFEFFPPKTEQASEKLFDTIKELEAHCPSFVSITYGAGGSTR